MQTPENTMVVKGEDMQTLEEKKVVDGRFGHRRRADIEGHHVRAAAREST